ncbi:MAG: hypothetical protein QW286_02465, partial [Candidatus Aenigmatarchaeota archaeon]
IEVSGIKTEWVSYQSQNIVDKGDRKLYVFVSPKETGTHTFSVKVKAEGEKLDFSQDVSVYTAPCDAKSKGWEITGYITETAKNPLFWILVILIVGGIILIWGASRLKPDVEYYTPKPQIKPVYAQRREQQNFSRTSRE